MEISRHTLYTDGGSRGNPGNGAIGGVLTDPKGKVLYEFAEVIGTVTNNQAEYRALSEGLRQARSFAVDVLDCFLDSELVVKQLSGQYRVKEADLKSLNAEVQELAKKFIEVRFKHVRREKNKRADQLVNLALDGKKI